jgi:hypothetical protein
VSQFTKWLPSLKDKSRSIDEDIDPIPCLIKLYSDNPFAMEELAKCRINPNLKSKQRRDLEFYIPQICSFYLQGYFSNVEALVNFIFQASGEYHFSHRVLFFFSSILFDKLTPEKQAIQKNCIDTVVNGLLG